MFNTCRALLQLLSVLSKLCFPQSKGNVPYCTFRTLYFLIKCAEGTGLTLNWVPYIWSETPAPHHYFYFGSLIMEWYKILLRVPSESIWLKGILFRLFDKCYVGISGSKLFCILSSNSRTLELLQLSCYTYYTKNGH